MFDVDAPAWWRCRRDGCLFAKFWHSGSPSRLNRYGKRLARIICIRRAGASTDQAARQPLAGFRASVPDGCGSSLGRDSSCRQQTIGIGHCQWHARRRCSADAWRWLDRVRLVRMAAPSCSWSWKTLGLIAPMPIPRSRLFWRSLTSHHNHPMGCAGRRAASNRCVGEPQRHQLVFVQGAGGTG